MKLEGKAAVNWLYAFWGYAAKGVCDSGSLRADYMCTTLANVQINVYLLAY